MHELQPISPRARQLGRPALRDMPVAPKMPCLGCLADATVPYGDRAASGAPSTTGVHRKRGIDGKGVDGNRCPNASMRKSTGRHGAYGDRDASGAP
jgi:hypothetical protein